jgi:hypothetical protein
MRSRLRQLLFVLAVVLSLCLTIRIRPDSVKDTAQDLWDNSLAGLNGIAVSGVGQEDGALALQGIANDWITQTAELRLRRNGIKILSVEEMQKAPGVPGLLITVRTLPKELLKMAR